jgi:primosomal protein N' (replication factor Y)
MKVKYYTTLSVCLRCAAPAVAALRSGLSRRGVTAARLAADTVSDIKDGPQARVIEYLKEHGAFPVKILINDLKISMSPVNTLVKKGMVVLEELKPDRPSPVYQKTQEERLVLTGEQDNALKRLSQALREPDKKPFLIHGVTGSGKTEIYLRLIEECINGGKQAIMLVPEIALTPQAVDAFTRRFGDSVAVTHSRLTPYERFVQWRRAREGEASVVIGPRSAIFTPFGDLGIIIIDEEHEKTYVSETTPKYAVLEVAEKLSELTGALVVLGSATPNVETYYRAAEPSAEPGKGMGLITLKHRVNNRFPEVHVTDMREELERGNRSIFSAELFTAIRENLELGRQTILFMNRRGHSTFVMCRSCGQALTCEKCSVNYTYHIYNNTLLCHYCGSSINPPDICPSCGSRHIRYFGVGTQKIEEEVNRLFPKAAAIRMDMDTTGKRGGHESLIRRFATGEAQILIGTQMIAKGLNFPNVSLVGIVDADTALNMGDFRSAETAFQLITQVSGRAGRADIPGRVYIQTYNPEHYSIFYAKAGDYKGFYDQEISLRRQMNYPPFSSIFMALFTCADEKRLITALKELSNLMNAYNRKGFFEMLGPSPAVISKINENYRWKILVKGKDEALMVKFVYFCVEKLAARVPLEGITMNMTLNPRMIV